MELDKEEKGKEAEARFKEWLDNHNIPYIYISQDIENFSTAFKKYFSGKRPDFIILIPVFGAIFVDVKFRIIDSFYNTLPLDSEDIRKYCSIHSSFNLPIFFAISNSDIDYSNWYWIPVSKLLSLRLPEHKSSVSEENFCPINLTYFTKISNTENINKLFYM